MYELRLRRVKYNPHDAVVDWKLEAHQQGKVIPAVLAEVTVDANYDIERAVGLLLSKLTS